MNGDGSASTALLELSGMRLLAVSEHDGELEQAVETDSTTAWCSGCGVLATAQGRRVLRVRDLPPAGRPVTLLWVKRLWRCAEPACRAGTWSEASVHVRPRASLTERARREACRQGGQDSVDVATVAFRLGVGWGTVVRAVREHAGPLISDPQRLTAVSPVGVDETAFLAGRAGRATEFITGIVALPGPGRGRGQLLDVVPGRSSQALRQ